MSHPLFARAPPRELASRGQFIETTEKLARFPKLAEAVRAELRQRPAEAGDDRWRQRPVRIRLEFGWADSEQRLPALEGRAAATIPALCQRCLEPLDVALEAGLKVLFCGPGASLETRSDYDLWELEGAKIRPLDLVDEALVMAMPLATLHESSASCGPLAKKLSAGTETSTRPFADLKSQMQNKH